MKKIAFIFVISLIFFSSCKKEESELEAKDITFSECQVKPKDLETSILWYDNVLTVTHEFLPVDCNFCGLVVSPSIDTEKKIIEIDVDPAVVQASLEPCECSINVSYRFENFYKKNAIYTIIIRENNQEIHRSEEAL